MRRLIGTSIAVACISAPSLAAQTRGPAGASAGFAKFPTARTAVAIRSWLTRSADLAPADIVLLTATSAFTSAQPPPTAHEQTGRWFRQEIFDASLAKTAGGRSVLMQLKLDCASGSAVLSALLVYAGNDLKGGPSKSPPSSQWTIVDPDAPLADLALLGCGAPAPPAPAPVPPPPPPASPSDASKSPSAAQVPTPPTDPDIEMLPDSPDDEAKPQTSAPPISLGAPETPPTAAVSSPPADQDPPAVPRLPTAEDRAPGKPSPPPIPPDDAPKSPSVVPSPAPQPDPDIEMLPESNGDDASPQKPSPDLVAPPS